MPISQERQAGATVHYKRDAPEEEILDSELTPLMVQAGMRAYAEWSDQPEPRRTLANMVSEVYAAAEAEKRRAR